MERGTNNRSRLSFQWNLHKPTAMERSPKTTSPRASSAGSSDGPAAMATTSIGHALLAAQPAVDDLPPVASAGPEIQQWRASVLKLAVEFQTIPGRRLRWDDRLGLQPSVPFLKKAGFSFVL